MKRRLLDRLLLPARVQAVEQRAPHLRQIALTGPGLAGLTWVPGQHVRLQVAEGHSSVDWLVGTLRTYSVWDYDGQTMQLIAFDHSDGPGAEWARAVRPGDELMLLKPQGNFVVSVQAPAAYHLFAGEETAQVAYGPMLGALPREARVFGRFEIDGPDNQLEPEQKPGPDFDLAWTYCEGRSAASSESLVAAVRDLDLPAEPGIAYLAGEARTIQMIRHHLMTERHWPRRSVITKPFWTPGRKGLD